MTNEYRVALPPLGEPSAKLPADDVHARAAGHARLLLLFEDSFRITLVAGLVALVLEPAASSRLTSAALAGAMVLVICDGRIIQQSFSSR